MSGAFILKVEPAQVSMIVDQYVISTEHGTTYFRRKTIGSTAYDTDWKQISYPFPDYTTLSTLASALGGRGYLYKTLSSGENFDDIITNGFYNYNSITSFSGIPSELVGGGNAFVLIVQEYDSMGKHQILMLTDSKGIYTRYRRSTGQWMSWFKQN